MCGRFVRQSSDEEFASLFSATMPTESNLTASYNITPSQAVLVARLNQQQQRELAALRWGLVPGWSKGPDNRYSMINARAETVASKPAYRNAFKRRRCLFAVDGFYEWKRQDNAKQPYYIHMAGDEPFAMAGLWEYWQGADGSVIESCAVITTTPNELMADIHDRMPVILAPDDYATWLDHNQTPDQLLKPYPAELMDAYPISTAVNSPKNNYAELLTPLAA